MLTSPSSGLMIQLKSQILPFTSNLLKSDMFLIEVQSRNLKNISRHLKAKRIS
jgi:hypothetical protein